MPAVAAAGLVGSLALATPAAADPEDASTQANIKPLILDQIPADGSNPSAEKTLWLDFDGGTIKGNHWNEVSGSEELRYESADRLSAKQRLDLYQVVVQAFAPFDVNVTTEKPSTDKLERSSLKDEEYGAVIHITDSNGKSPGFGEIFKQGYAGIAPLGGFGDLWRNHAWATTDIFNVGQMEGSKQVQTQEEAPEALMEPYRGVHVGNNVVHELGHTIGLEHHGWKKGDEQYEYYTPGVGWQQNTASVWGPIMGAPHAGMYRWSSEYPGASNGGQDDLKVMTADLSEKDSKTEKRVYDGETRYLGKYCYYPNDDDTAYKGPPDNNGRCNEDEPLEWRHDYVGRLEFRSNKESNSDSRARVLDIQDGKASLYGEFVKNLDEGKGNWYVFDAAAGPVNLNVTPQQPFSALDLKVTLYDANLKAIASADPGLKNVYDQNGWTVAGKLEGQDAAIQHIAAAPATYYVKVEQTSFGDMGSLTATKAPAAPRYGNLGVYQVNLEAQGTQELALPAPDATYGEVVTGTGIAGATVDVDTANGKLIGSAQVGADGKFEVKLDPAAEVGDELLVSQSKDGLKSRPVAVTVVEEAKPEVKVKVDPSKITEGDDGGVTVVGTGFAAGQKVSGVVNSEPVELGTKIADDEGRVEFLFDASKLEVGKHKVTLTADDDKDYTGSASLTVVKADDDEPSPEPSDDETPSPEPSDDETPSPEPSDDETTPPPSDGDDSGNDDGGLPSTGASTALTLFGIGGIVLVGSGVTIAAAARRRNKA